MMTILPYQKCMKLANLRSFAYRTMGSGKGWIIYRDENSSYQCNVLGRHEAMLELEWKAWGAKPRTVNFDVQKWKAHAKNLHGVNEMRLITQISAPFSAPLVLSLPDSIHLSFQLTGKNEKKKKYDFIPRKTLQWCKAPH